MNENWFKDIMVQKYQCDNYYDPTKLFLVLALTEENKLKQRYTIKEISQYIYRYYVANDEIATHNFNITVRNIKKYGINDIISFVEASIKQWIKEQKYNSILLQDSIVILNLEQYDQFTLQLSRTMAATLFQKYYKANIKYIDKYNDLLALNDLDVSSFGMSRLKRKIFEDVQYCPITEETKYENLCVVHILPFCESKNKDDMLDKDNMMLFSKEIAKEYNEKLFFIDVFGRVINNGSLIVNNKMRISMNLMNEKRREYVKRHLEKNLKN